MRCATKLYVHPATCNKEALLDVRCEIEAEKEVLELTFSIISTFFTAI